MSTDIDNIYEENRSFLLGKLAFILMVCITLLFLFLYVYQTVSGPLGTKPAPDWFYLVMFILFIGISYLVSNFQSLKIRMNSRGITVAYGRFKYAITWDNITECHLDDRPGFQYGGWGIRMGKNQGKWILVYNVINAPLVVLELVKGRFGYFAFSTGNAGDVMGIIEQHKGK